MNGQRPIYKLGRFAFSLTHADPDFEPVLARLLSQRADENLDSDKILDVQMGLSFNLSECFAKIINQHAGCLLIQAACIESPNGKRALISGVPNSGKTTLALALAFQFGWKVLSEDFVIIDTEENQIISFAAPFNLKPGTRDVLRSAGIELPGFILREWFPLNEEMIAMDSNAHFAMALHLNEAVVKEPLTCAHNTVSEHIRKILPISNLLALRATNKFEKYLPKESCYTISGGNISERLQKIVEYESSTNA